uniref:SsgA family sporulation/cell division regulator n=1 Tax=Sphaerisporangium sp. CA-236357 TaxID=3240030 RepID=UPI003F491C8A
MSARIEHHVTLWQPAPSMFTHAATLVYDPADPYAVALEFTSPSGRPDGGHVWGFARELLVDAVELGAVVGQGEVHLAPEAALTADVQWLTITLCPGQPGALELLLQQRSAQLFLADTYAAVPVGTEACRIDWDAELAQVLGGAA